MTIAKSPDSAFFQCSQSRLSGVNVKASPGERDPMSQFLLVNLTAKSSASVVTLKFPGNVSCWMAGRNRL